MISVAAAIALCLALAAAWMSARRALRLGRALDLDADLVATWAKRRTSKTWSLRRAIGEDGLLAPLAAALDDASRAGGDTPGRAHERGCNEALVDLSDALRHDDDLHLGALRLCGYASALAAVLTVFEPLLAAASGLTAAAQPVTILDALAVGGGSFVSALATRRASQRASRRQRTAVDRWVAAVISPPSGGDARATATGSRSRSR